MRTSLWMNATGFVILSGILLQGVPVIHAQETEALIEELKNKIGTTGSEIEEINAQIERLSKELKETATEKKTLDGKIKEIDYTRKIIAGDISATEHKIARGELTIEELDLAIEKNKTQSKQHRKQIAATLRAVHEQDTESLIEILLREKQLSAAWTTINDLQQIQVSLRTLVSNLTQTNVELASQIGTKKGEISQLDTLRETLADKKRIADGNRSKQAVLLSATQKQESTYQALLAQELERKRQFESELLRLEQELQFTLDPSTLPEDGSLSWPIDGTIVITQHFGDTSFSRRNVGIYNGNGHRGIDLRASIGTELRAAASGVVIGTGNTDNTCKGASYGKWVLIRHGNGLATLYAHLDLIKAVEGETVVRGELIGYSGDTGYTTGPHLHFTVFVADAVKVSQLPSKNPACGIYTLPISPLNGYLSPLQYLP
ncbi:MAG: peptidoglycan DD-metalloendopeptidase family protein [bacterium]|nr:peptidoglycan DD-metalloendopeptidase family protein [bacterium]